MSARVASGATARLVEIPRNAIARGAFILVAMWPFLVLYLVLRVIF